jgi:hypothetical protein
MEDALKTIILVSYTPNEYEKILAISEDRDEMDQDWVQCLLAGNRKKFEIIKQGFRPLEQLIDAEGLLKYCQAEGKPVNAQARADYANVLYEMEKKESITSSDKPEEEEAPKPSAQSYTSPVDKLLTYTDIEKPNPLPEISYAETFGIGPEHVPELIRMATDDYLASEAANNFEFTAPLHAVMALAELRAEEAIEPLLSIYDKTLKTDHEWMRETLVDVFTIFGAVALPALEQFLADASHEELSLNYVAEILGRIAQKHPDARAECIAVATRRLTDFQINNPELNAVLITELVHMKAVEAAPLIEEAYANDRVDESWFGDWNEVQYEFGLKERPPREERRDIFSPLSMPTTRPTTGMTPTVAHRSTGKAPASKKAKNKMVKASKKANRRKR